MRAMVLAAGRGERLRPLTDTLPKPMIPLAGKPLIHYTLTYLKNCGVEEVVVNLHHLGDMIREYVGDGREWGLLMAASVLMSIVSSSRKSSSPTTTIIQSAGGLHFNKL